MVPDQEVTIPDLVRGDVTFNTNTLGDFVILRSNGLPVYVGPPAWELLLKSACAAAASV